MIQVLGIIVKYSNIADTNTMYDAVVSLQSLSQDFIYF